MPVALSSIHDMLLPGLRAVTGKYQQIPRQYDKIFQYIKSEQAVERTIENRYLPLARLKNEGATTVFDNRAGQRFTWNQSHLEIALGYAITRPAIDDNLYKTQFNPSNLGLQESFNQTKEIYAASVFNLGFVYQQAVGGDGQPLFSTVHPIDGGSYANAFTTAADLSETTLLSAMISIRRQFVDQAALKLYARAKMLLIPPELEPVAIRLLETQLRPGTGDNDVNAIRSTTGGLKEGYFVNDYLTSAYSWFLLTNVPGLAYMERIPFEMSMEVEFSTDNLLVKGYERYSLSYYNPRSAYGTNPTS
jgi:hypothetical protein